MVDSISDDEASRFLDFSNRYQNEQNGYSWETQRLRRFQFAAQLIPESRVSELEREKITLLLSELSKSPSFDWIVARKLLITQIRWLPSPDRVADLPLPFVEQFLNDGQFANGETALLRALDANPTDEETRLGLGLLQFARALENLGKALYEYGAVSEKSRMPFLRLPVPRNPTPSAISYKAFGRMLDVFAEDLSRVEANLALISNDNVKLRLRLAKITFDFAGTGKDRTTLLDILSKLSLVVPHNPLGLLAFAFVKSTGCDWTFESLLRIISTCTIEFPKKLMLAIEKVNISICCIAYHSV